MLKRIVFIVTFACFAYNANSASFDCSKASSPLEKAICSNPNLSALDDQMAQAYKDARAKSSNQDQLKSDQIAWIKGARQCASDLACIEKSYKERLAALGAATSVAPSNASIGGSDNSTAAMNRLKALFELHARAIKDAETKAGVEGKSAFTTYTTTIAGKCLLKDGSNRLAKMSNGDMKINSFWTYNFSQITSSFVSPVAQYTYANDKNTNDILKDSTEVDGYKFVVGTKGGDERIMASIDMNGKLSNRPLPLWGIPTKTSDEANAIKKAMDDVIATCKN